MAGKTENRQAELQQKYVALQMIEAQMKELQEELEKLEHRNQELVKLGQSLGEFSTGKPGKSLSSVGMGIYAESELKNTKEVLVNVGSGILVKKQVSETKDLIQKQIEASAEILEKLTQNMQLLVRRANELQGELQELVKD
ncbi:MAG: prefoldin subunit alpha [DPANN group archaeon]|nr:prefoldin subunit alpha [DPANN group archaeon]